MVDAQLSPAPVQSDPLDATGSDSGGLPEKHRRTGRAYPCQRPNVGFDVIGDQLALPAEMCRSALRPSARSRASWPQRVSKGRRAQLQQAFLSLPLGLLTSSGLTQQLPLISPIASAGLSSTTV